MIGIEAGVYFPSLYGMASGIGIVYYLGKVEISSPFFFIEDSLGSGLSI